MILIVVVDFAIDDLRLPSRVVLTDEPAHHHHCRRAKQHNRPRVNINADFSYNGKYPPSSRL
jgi:hypothetical protein